MPPPVGTTAKSPSPAGGAKPPPGFEEVGAKREVRRDPVSWREARSANPGTSSAGPWLTSKPGPCAFRGCPNKCSLECSLKMCGAHCSDPQCPRHKSQWALAEQAKTRNLRAPRKAGQKSAKLHAEFKQQKRSIEEVAEGNADGDDSSSSSSSSSFNSPSTSGPGPSIVSELLASSEKRVAAAAAAAAASNLVEGAPAKARPTSAPK